MSSRIAEIVDYTAQVAGRIAGVTAVFGVGTGLVGDPRRPGQTIAAAPDAPTSAFTHWSDLPDSTAIERLSQTSDEYTWDLPMRLWLPRADMANMRRLAVPFYASYTQAFMADPTLGGLCLVTGRMTLRTGDDDVWAWIDVNLEVTEVVSH